MGENRKSESENRVEKSQTSEKTETSEKILSEQTRADQKNILEERKKKTDKELPVYDLELFDSSMEATLVRDEQPVGEKNEVISFKSGDKEAKLELDEEGLPKKYTDFNGDVYEKQASGEFTRSNLMGSENVRLAVDSSKSVTVTFENGDARTTRPDGAQETQYVNGAKTTLTRNGDTSLVVESNGKPLQTLQFKGDILVNFTAPDGTVYQRKDPSTAVDDYKRVAWTKTAPGGQPEDFEGSINADSNGSVIVRNETLAEKEPKSDQYAIRFLNNGTKVTSDKGEITSSMNSYVLAGVGLTPEIERLKPPATRTVTSQDGLIIKDTNSEGQQSSRSYTYPNGAGEIIVSYDESGKPLTVKGTAGDKVVDYSRADVNSPWKDADGNTNIEAITLNRSQPIEIRMADKSTHVIDNFGQIKSYAPNEAVPLNNVESRTLIQEMPENNAEELLNRARAVSEYPTTIPENFESDVPLTFPDSVSEKANWVRQLGLKNSYALYTLIELTKDGGPFDDKQKGGQFEKVGNFNWGVYAAAMGLPEDFAIKCCGLYKANAEKSDNKGNVTDFTKNKPGQYPYGQNLQDAEAIKAGYKYYREQVKAKLDAEKVQQTPSNNVAQLAQPVDKAA